MSERKILVVGDGACGKSTLLHAFTRGEFQLAYVPTVFESYQSQVTTGGKTAPVSLHDTAGQVDYEQVRVLQYPGTDVILLCFSVDSPDTLENIPSKWLPEVRHYCPHAPLLLVCNKVDLRPESDVVENGHAGKMTNAETNSEKKDTEEKGDLTEPIPNDSLSNGAENSDDREGLISRSEGEIVAKEINALYVECSAKTGEGVNKLFEEATRVALENRKKRKTKNCTLV